MGDYEAPEAYVCDHPKARKDHKCCECRGVIKVGEVYNRHHGIWDGEPDSYKVCSDCDFLRVRLGKLLKEHDPWEEPPPFEGLSDAIFEENLFEKEFIDIKRKRGAVIPDWMEQWIADT